VRELVLRWKTEIAAAVEVPVFIGQVVKSNGWPEDDE